MARFKITHHTKMKKKVKKRWVKALKNGKYKHNKQALKVLTSEGYAYSALGVLVEVLREMDLIWLNWKTVKPSFDRPVRCSLDGAEYFLPYRVCKIAGVTPDGRLNQIVERKGKRHSNISDMEQVGVPLKFIAKVINEQF